MTPAAATTNASRVVRGGGETRRKTAIALALSFTMALMMLAQPVAAGTVMAEVTDGTGDVGRNRAQKVSDPSQYWEENTPVAQAGYFDMVSTWLSQKGNKYTFGMELAAELPQEGAALPDGIKLAEWIMWIDPAPWGPGMDPVASLFRISLYYDGSSYSAFMLDYGTMVMTPIPFSVDGSSFQLQFSAASISNLAFEWWCPGVRAWWGLFGSTGAWIVDLVDFGAAPGQVGIDLPWPPV